MILEGIYPIVPTPFLDDGSVDLPSIERLIGCIPNYGGALVDPGHLEYVHEGPIQMGELDGRDTLRLRGIASLLEKQTAVELTDNMWGQLWAKQVYSSRIIFSALAEPTPDQALGSTLDNERNQRMSAALVKEALQVRKAWSVVGLRALQRCPPYRRFSVALLPQAQKVG